MIQYFDHKVYANQYFSVDYFEHSHIACLNLKHRWINLYKSVIFHNLFKLWLPKFCRPIKIFIAKLYYGGTYTYNVFLSCLNLKQYFKINNIFFIIRNDNLRVYVYCTYILTEHNSILNFDGLYYKSN